MGLIFQAVFFFPILKHGQGHVLLQKPWLLSGFKDPWRHTPIRNVWEYPPPSPGRRVIACRRTVNPLLSPPSLIPPPPFQGRRVNNLPSLLSPPPSPPILLLHKNWTINVDWSVIIVFGLRQHDLQLHMKRKAHFWRIRILFLLVLGSNKWIKYCWQWL